MHDVRHAYRWQDHVITTQRTTADLVATALIILAVGGGVVAGTAMPRPPLAAAVTEWTPSLSQMARRPITPRAAADCL
jgi:hypothetical protein